MYKRQPYTLKTNMELKVEGLEHEIPGVFRFQPLIVQGITNPSLRETNIFAPENECFRTWSNIPFGGLKRQENPYFSEELNAWLVSRSVTNLSGFVSGPWQYFELPVNQLSAGVSMKKNAPLGTGPMVTNGVTWESSVNDRKWIRVTGVISSPLYMQLYELWAPYL